MSILERPLRRLADSPIARAATWPHGIDGIVGAFDTAWSSRSVRARIAGIRRQTGDTVTLTLRPNANWQGHQAGQHRDRGIADDLMPGDQWLIAIRQSTEGDVLQDVGCHDQETPPA